MVDFWWVVRRIANWYDVPGTDSTCLVRAEAQPLEVDNVVVRFGHAGGADFVGEEEGDAVPACVEECVVSESVLDAMRVRI